MTTINKLNIAKDASRNMNSMREVLMRCDNQFWQFHISGIQIHDSEVFSHGTTLHLQALKFERNQTVSVTQIGETYELLMKPRPHFLPIVGCMIEGKNIRHHVSFTQKSL